MLTCERRNKLPEKEGCTACERPPSKEVEEVLKPDIVTFQAMHAAKCVPDAMSAVLAMCLTAKL